MNAREEIASALNQLENLNISPEYKQVTRPGDGFVAWGGLTASENGFGYMDSWEVLLVIPSDIAAAERYIQENVTEIVDALDQVMHVERATPTTLSLLTGTANALVIEGTLAH